MKLKAQNRTRAEIRVSRRNFTRKTISILLLLISIIPMLGGRVQPLWVIPAAICIAIREDFYFSMIAGVIAGFGIDIACGNVLGANAIYMTVICSAVTLLFTQLLRPGFFHFFWLTALCTFLRAGLYYFLTAVIFRIESREVLWSAVLLPSSLLTLVAAVPVYLFYLPCMKLLTRRIRSMDAAAIRRDW